MDAGTQDGKDAEKKQECLQYLTKGCYPQSASSKTDNSVAGRMSKNPVVDGTHYT